MVDKQKKTNELSFYEARRGFLIGFHLPVQRIMVRIVGPLSTLLYIYSAFADPAWQNFVTLGGMIAMWGAWVLAIYTTQKKADLEGSVFIFSISVILFETLETCLIEGTAATALLGNVSVTIYAALFSKRYLYYTAGASLLSFISSEIIRFVQPWPIKVLPPDERLAVQIIFSVLLFFMATLILRRSQTINEALYKEMRTANEAMGEIITAASQVQPVVKDVTRGIREISSNLASQATEQAASTAQINSTMRLIQKIANNTASSASATRKTAEQTRDASKQTTRNLQSVQNGFNDVVEIVEQSRAKTSEFSSWAENIESILSTNQQISNQIKILSVNAAIQAAKAGQYGRGFRVIAGEMRSLIGNIDSNLESSAALLEEIRREATISAETIQKGADLLRKHYNHLRETSEAVATIDDAFSRTTTSVEEITDEALKQSNSVNEITVSMSQVDVAAGQMQESARTLLASVERIVESHDSLRKLLESPGTTLVGEKASG